MSTTPSSSTPGPELDLETRQMLTALETDTRIHLAADHVDALLDQVQAGTLTAAHYTVLADHLFDDAHQLI
jgi:hypothetical protein